MKTERLIELLQRHPGSEVRTSEQRQDTLVIESGITTINLSDCTMYEPDESPRDTLYRLVESGQPVSQRMVSQYNHDRRYLKWYGHNPVESIEARLRHGSYIPDGLVNAYNDSVSDADSDILDRIKHNRPIPASELDRYNSGKAMYTREPKKRMWDRVKGLTPRYTIEDIDINNIKDEIKLRVNFNDFILPGMIDIYNKIAR